MTVSAIIFPVTVAAAVFFVFTEEVCGVIFQSRIIKLIIFFYNSNNVGIFFVKNIN